MPTIFVKDALFPRYLQSENGETLLAALRRHGYSIFAPCGGAGWCGKCLMKVVNNNQGLTNGENYHACKIIIAGDITVAPLTVQQAIQSNSLIQATQVYCGGDVNIAIDIGTTTIAIAILDKDGITDIVTFNNPQVVYGADVISRIEYCKNNGVEDLHNILIESLNKNIAALTTKYHIDWVKSIAVAGNTTMLHILYKYDCSGLGSAPYTPKFLGRQSADAAELGIKKASKIFSLPNIASFVGADITSGLQTLRQASAGKYNILIDFGTNAEVVVFNNDKYVCTATAAGPCFEGGNISCGKSASRGAITHFSLTNGIADIQQIGDTPNGICGTGLVDIVKELLANNIIDKTGAFCGEPCYRLTDKLTITQKDIREFQLAKAAVRAGVEVLLEELGATYDDVDTVYLSGGMASAINIENAAAVGLIAKEILSKCITVGNTSLKGAIAELLGASSAEDICAKAQFIDLTGNKIFFEKYIDNMTF